MPALFTSTSSLPKRLFHFQQAAAPVGAAGQHPPEHRLSGALLPDLIERRPALLRRRAAPRSPAVNPSSRQLERDAQPDAARASGYQRNLALIQHLQSLSPVSAALKEGVVTSLGQPRHQQHRLQQMIVAPHARFAARNLSPPEECNPIRWADGKCCAAGFLRAAGRWRDRVPPAAAATPSARPARSAPASPSTCPSRINPLRRDRAGGGIHRLVIVVGIRPACRLPIAESMQLRRAGIPIADAVKRARLVNIEVTGGAGRALQHRACLRLCRERRRRQIRSPGATE